MRWKHKEFRYADLPSNRYYYSFVCVYSLGMGSAAGMGVGIFWGEFSF